MDFYTSVCLNRGRFLVRGFQEGVPYQKEVQWNPYLFIPCKPNEATHKTLDNKPVAKKEFADVSEFREFLESYKDLDGFSFYGMTDIVYPFINDNWQGQINYDQKLIRIGYLDIEVDSSDGFPNVEEADKQLTAITLTIGGKITAIGLKEFEAPAGVVYHKCATEEALIRKFLDVWETQDFDVISGWNVEFFDIPYLVNRIRRVLSDAHVKRMSPWGVVFERKVKRGKGPMATKEQTYNLLGLNILDYYNLYQKFSMSAQESYALGHIAFIELGEHKIDYSQHGSLAELYEKDHQLFMEYNIHDAVLVERLEAQLGFISQAIGLAYDAKINYNDSLTSVKLWDVIIHNYLMDKGVVVPLEKHTNTKEVFEGAHVKEVLLGAHDWVVSFDLASLYPHLIMQYNISPETLVNQVPMTVNGMLTGAVASYAQELKEENNCIAANGTIYTKSRRGFLPELMAKIISDRKLYKNKMLEVKAQLVKDPDNQELQRLAKMYNNIQGAKKIQANSAYGAISNIWFRFYDLRMAEAITLSGQVSIRWMIQRMNDYLNKILKTNNIDYVIAADTDSMYLNLNTMVKQAYDGKPAPTPQQVVEFLDKACNKILQPFITKSYQELADYTNAYEQQMIMKRESIASKGIWTAKKNYILNVWNQEGVAYKEAQMKMTGVTAVRSTIPAICKEAVKKAYVLTLTSTEADLIKFITEFREKFQGLDFEKIAFPRGVKDLSSYKLTDKGIPIHVKGSLTFNYMVDNLKLKKKYQLIKDGEKIKFCYLKMPNPSKSHVIASNGPLPLEFGLGKYIDYDTQFDKTFLEPVKIVLDVIGWKSEHVASIEDFFS